MWKINIVVERDSGRKFFLFFFFENELECEKLWNGETLDRVFSPETL